MEHNAPDIWGSMAYFSCGSYRFGNIELVCACVPSSLSSSLLSALPSGLP